MNSQGTVFDSRAPLFFLILSTYDQLVVTAIHSRQPTKGLFHSYERQRKSQYMYPPDPVVQSTVQLPQNTKSISQLPK